MYVILSTAAKVHEKDDPLHSSRCSVVGEIGADRKNDSLLYSKTKEGIKKE
jgi:hypothetical protein